MRVDLNLLVKMANPHSNAEYKILLDSKGEPSLDDAESHQALEPLRVEKAKSRNPHNIWIFHLAMVTLYSTVFILIAWKNHANYYHGPGLIFCMSVQSWLQKRNWQDVEAPARDAVEYEKVTFDGSFIIESPFAGVRGPEMDQAWHDLLRSKWETGTDDVLNLISSRCKHTRLGRYAEEDRAWIYPICWWERLLCTTERVPWAALLGTYSFLRHPRVGIPTGSIRFATVHPLQLKSKNRGFLSLYLQLESKYHPIVWYCGLQICLAFLWVKS